VNRSRQAQTKAVQIGDSCAWQESNLRPRAPEARALSPELQARAGQSSAASTATDRLKRRLVSRTSRDYPPVEPEPVMYREEFDGEEGLEEDDT
jgi:hypothetical protein